MLKTSSVKSAKYLLASIDNIKKDRTSDIKLKNRRKNRNETIKILVKLKS